MNKYYLWFREGSKVNQVICALLINLPGFAYGASIGWMSPMTLLLQSTDSPRGTPLTEYEVSVMGAMTYLACVPSTILLATFADKFGRKLTMFVISFMGVACWVIKLSSMEIWAFILARGLAGVVSAGCYVTCPMYTKEISENSIRGLLGSLLVLFHTTGNLFSYIIGDILSYRAVLWVCLSLPTIHIVLFIMMPESPSYLMKKGDLQKAGEALAWLRCRNVEDAVIVNELNQMKKEQDNDDENKNFALKAILSDKILTRAFKIAIAIAVAREFCGAIPVMNFAGEIFTKSSEGGSGGLVLTPNQQAMLLGAVQVVGSSLTFSVVENAGRKFLLLVTSLVSGLSMVGLGTWFLGHMYNYHAPGWIPITTLCLSIFCDAFGLNPMSVIIASEIFSFKYRATVMATAMALSSFSAFIQMLFFKPIISIIGIYVTFYIFGGVCLAMALYTLLVVPETKFRGLEEIYEDLKTKKEKKLELKSSI